MTPQPHEHSGLLFSRKLAQIGVPHAFTIRGRPAAGVSRGIFESLNFGNPSDLAGSDRDTAANINENWRRVGAAIGALTRQLVQVHQVHGAETLLLRRDITYSPETFDSTIKADVIVTDNPELLATVRTADCAPVLLSSADGRVVAAVHAGWKGTVAGAAAAAIRHMESLGASRRDITAAIGPCIGPAAFEVDGDVVAEFARTFPDDDSWRVTAQETRHGTKARIDLKAALFAQLVRAGLDPSQVEVLPGCTASEPDRFFSHRRDKGRTGRMAAVIGSKSP